MNTRLLLLVAGFAAAIACPGAAAAAAGAVPPDRLTPDPSPFAVGYLEARAAAVLAPDPAAIIARWTLPAAPVTARETAVARGAARRAARLGHGLNACSADVSVTATHVSPDGGTATVAAHAVTTVVWHSGEGDDDREAAGVDHTLTLARAGDGWLVTADEYYDVLTPAYLEAEGAAPARVAGAARRLERRRHRATQTSATGAAPARLQRPRRYNTIRVYDRNACKAYADKYALSYNPTYVRFAGADCANFASQCGYAGGMPQTPGGWSSGWWYDKAGTSSPSNDSYSLSWINVPKQMGFWNQRLTDRASSIGGVGKGDFVYYDWSGDGVWDHVAVLVGTNSAGKKVVDAHTTDHYHVYWKMGYSSTRYKFARARDSWII